MEHFFEEKSKRATIIRWILGKPMENAGNIIPCFRPYGTTNEEH